MEEPEEGVAEAEGQESEAQEAWLAPGPARRLDRALAEAFPALSRSRLQALVRDGMVAVEDVPARDPSAKVLGGARVRLVLPPALAPLPEGEAIPLSVVYEDESLVVIDKPAGLVVHPGPGHPRGTLVNALIHHCGASLSGIGGVRRPGIVHRLDRDTSGLLVVAKTDLAHQALARQFADHGRTGPLERAYLALAWGAPARGAGRVEAALARHPSHREKIAVTTPERGRFAATRYAVLERFPPDEEAVASLLRCELETGRTHQIRVHLAHLGHPLLGDPLYGSGFRTRAARLGATARDALEGLGRQALHAAVLGFAHPLSEERLRFESRLPPDLAALVAALRAG